MTNYRIDRIGTHRRASTRIGTEFDHIDTAKQGQGYKSTVQGVNIGQTGGKVSKQMASCRRPQDKTSKDNVVTGRRTKPQCPSNKHS